MLPMKPYHTEIKEEGQVIHVPYREERPVLTHRQLKARKQKSLRDRMDRLTGKHLTR